MYLLGQSHHRMVPVAEAVAITPRPLSTVDQLSLQHLRHQQSNLQNLPQLSALNRHGKCPNTATLAHKLTASHLERSLRTRQHLRQRTSQDCIPVAVLTFSRLLSKQTFKLCNLRNPCSPCSPSIPAATHHRPLQHRLQALEAPELVLLLVRPRVHRPCQLPRLLDLRLP